MEFQTIAELIEAGKHFGIFQFYLPFLLTFVLVFGLLRKAKVFGPYRHIDVAIALIAATYIMIYSPIGLPLAQFLTNLFGHSLLAIVTLVVILLILGPLLDFFGLEVPVKRRVKTLLAIIILLAVVIFIVSGGLTLYLPALPPITIPILPLPPVGIAPAHIAIITLVIFTGLLIWWLVKEERR